MLARWSWASLFAATMFTVAILAGACGGGGSNSYGGDSSVGDGGMGSDVMTFGGDGGGIGLVVAPAAPTLNVTGAGTSLQFQAFVGGSTTPSKATWTIDVADIGTIDNTGLFTATAKIGGPTTVTALVGTLTGSTILTVHLSLIDNPGNIDPGTQAMLKAGGTGDPAFKWLYPYDRTVFARGIAPPVLQTAGTAYDAAYLHISSTVLDYQGFYGAANPARLPLSSALWNMISMSTAGTDNVQVQLTKISAGAVAGPVTEAWTIAQGTLRGTVYYNSYNSQLAGNTGAVMGVRPGGSAQVVVAGCRVCHTVSADGSTLVSANEPPGGPATDRVWDLTNNAAPVYDAQNRTWAFGALYPDASKFLRFGVIPDQNLPGASWAPNVRGLGQWGDMPSALFNTKTGAAIPAPGLDGANLHMMMPIFSPDGKMVAFNHYDSGQGHSVAVMDFNVMTNTFSNMRDVATIPSVYLGWPTFTPDNKFLLFAAGTNIEYDTVSDNTMVIPQPTSDIYVAHIPTKTQAPADELNGKAGGMYYLPFGEAAEGHLNYEPTIMPLEIGGYYWVVFTTRREYGNTLNDADPYNLNAMPGARKKLWVSAIDIDSVEHPITTAADITHPPFYLDGQELSAGNMRGFWARDPCKQNGNTCMSGDECCGGYCRQANTDAGQAFVCVPPMGCAKEAEKCTTTADCCSAGGAVCIGGFCATPAK
jgi:hypothetical protein